jgi:hypothetical protein
LKQKLQKQESHGLLGPLVASPPFFAVIVRLTPAKLPYRQLRDSLGGEKIKKSA